MIIADDEPLALTSEELLFQKEFPEISIVGKAADGVELKQMLKDLNPDMAVVDIQMPGLSGIEVIELLSHQNRLKTHFIIYSAYGNFAYIKKALDLKTDGYLLKPAKKEEWREMIDKLEKRIDEEREQNMKVVRLQNAMHIVNPLLGSEILRAIVLGESSEESFNAYCSINNLSFYKGCIITLLVKLQNDSDREQAGRELENALGQMCEFLYLLTENGIHIMLFVPPELDDGQQEKWCNDLAYLAAKKVETSMGKECIYGVGACCDSFSMMHLSYRESTEKIGSVKRESRPDGMEETDKANTYLVRAKQYIRTYYPRDISLTGCAEEVGISPYYLSHIFKERTGKTFVDYLSEVRIGEAKKLAAGSSLTIKEIAERVGYTNTTYFCKVFKRITGLTIGEYRRKHIRT